MKKLKVDSTSAEQASEPSLFTRLTGFDLGSRGLAASGLSIVTAGALLTGVVPGLDLGSAQPVTLEPELPNFGAAPYENGDPIRPDDGLTRLIVTPTAQSLDEEPATLDTPAPDQPSGSGRYQDPSKPSPEADQPIGDLSELEALRNAPKGSTLVVTVTGLAVRYPDGTIVALDDVLNPPTAAAPITEAETATQPEASEPEPATMAEQLASLPGVDSAYAIGDGSYSVALSDPAALDGLPLEAREQTFLALFAEPYEPYEWHIENDGASMSRFGMSPTLDADIDGTVAIEHATGRGVVIAVVDTGVDFSHPDLADNKWDNPGEICGNGTDDDGNGYVDDCHGFDFVYRDGTGYNSGAHNHGTHVAGTISAARNGVGVAGVAPDARIMDLNVSATDGSLAEAAIAEAVRYAADNGADVINMSLGTKPGGAASASIGAAIDYAGTKGVLVVVAAGNDNTNLDVSEVWPASYDKANMMTVGATTSDDTRASFSNYGSALDIFAPGDLILSTVPGADQYYFMSGTSMATPIVVGTAALLLSDDPSLSPQQIISQLQTTSDISPSLEGFGANGARVNAGEALGGATPDSSPITELAVTMTGLGNLTTASALTSNVRFAVPDDEFDEEFRWEMALLSSENNDVYALIDYPLELTGTATTTGATGSLDLGVTGTSSITLSAALPAGDYGLMFEAVPTADPGSRLGNPFVAAFSVRNASVEQPGETSSPDSGTPDSGTPDSGTPDSSTPDSSTPDSSTPDNSTPDNSTPDNSTPDNSTPDNGTPDSGATPGAGAPDSTPTTPTTPAPNTPAPNTPAPGTGEGSGNGDGGGAGGGSENPTTSPAPTTPPADGGAGTSPVAPVPQPVEQGRYSVRAVSPHVGPVGERTEVTVTGEFPDPVRVYFGSVEATSLSQTSSRLVALAPAGSTEGTVSIRLVRNGATVLTVQNGFTYQAVASDAPTPAPGNDQPTTGQPTSGTPTPGDESGGDSGGNPGTGTPNTSPPTNTSPPNTSPPTSTPPTTAPPTNASNPPAGNAANDRSRQSRGTVGSDRVDLGGGRTGAPIAGSNPLASAPACQSNSCAARSA